MPRSDSGSVAFGKSMTERPDGSRLPLMDIENHRAEETRRRSADTRATTLVQSPGQPKGFGGVQQPGTVSNFRSRIKGRSKRK